LIEWRDEGVLLAVRKHGENAVIIDVLTQSHGRHAGVVRGGAGRKQAPVLQPGAQLDLVWKARLEEHLGSFTVEPLRSRAAQVMTDPLALAGLSSTVGLLCFSLPEREIYPKLYTISVNLLDLMCVTDAWPLAYLQWEIQLLEMLGFGLDLSRCAVSGGIDDLTYISPKTGRAVAAHHAGEWKTRLLPLVPCMKGEGNAENNEISEGLRTTGHFLEKWLAPSLGDRPLPVARQRLVDRLILSARA
jgi:DNA repair protein RecO (recombination protein O)|tara:strand:- start:3653 stop:4387 length:735 start_codon:yes stop_codon:yes gene_type:complete